MGAVTALFRVPVPTTTILFNVASCIVSTLVVDGEDERGLFPSRGRLLMDRYLLFVLGWLIMLFCSCPSTSGGRAFRLLNYRHLDQSLHLVSNAPCLGIRGLGHITQQHLCRHNVLACSREAADRLFWLPIPNDLPMYLSSPSTDTSARWVRQVLLKDLLGQDETLAILVKFRLELSQLRKLHGSVLLRRGVDLTIVPRRPGVFPCCRGLTASSSVLCFVSSFHRPIDVEALPSRVVAVGSRAGVRLGGVEASASFLQQPLSEGGNHVPPRA